LGLGVAAAKIVVGRGLGRGRLGGDVAGGAGAGAYAGVETRLHLGLAALAFFIEDLVEDLLALRRQLVEADPHSGRHARAGRVVPADPDYRALARDQRRGVLELKLELQLGSNRQRLLGPDEDAPAAHVDGVALDELIKVRALELDLQRDRGSHVS